MKISNSVHHNGIQHKSKLFFHILIRHHAIFKDNRMRHDEKTPLKFFAFFFFEKLLRSPAAIIIIDYCAAICIIDPRQKVKRFISQSAYFEIVYYPLLSAAAAAALLH